MTQPTDNLLYSKYIMNVRFGEKLLILFLGSFVILTVLGSLYRFIIIQDYLVTYEIDCDPETQYCYTGCEDDECFEEYFYQEIERHASMLLHLCGADISDCEDASTCTAGELECTVTTCDLTDTFNECAGPNK